MKLQFFSLEHSLELRLWVIDVVISAGVSLTEEGIYVCVLIYVHIRFLPWDLFVVVVWDLFIFILRMYLPACWCTMFLQRPEEGIRPLELALQMLLAFMWCWKSNLGSLEEQPVLSVLIPLFSSQACLSICNNPYLSNMSSCWYHQI